MSLGGGAADGERSIGLDREGVLWMPVEGHGRYRFDELIRAKAGQGGEAEVWRVQYEPAAGQSPVEAVLKRRVCGSNRDEAWDAERTALTRLNPDALNGTRSWRVPQLHASWRDEDYLYLLLDDVSGTSVEELIATAPGGLVPLAVVRRVVTGLSDALVAAHQVGVVHGDLSPDNVLLRRGDAAAVVLLDWGMANIDGALSSPRGFNRQWASDRQLRGEPPDACSDVWSFARLSFFLLTGRIPATNREPASQFRRDVGEGVDRLIRRVLEGNAGSEACDAAELGRSLLRALPIDGPTADRVTSLRQSCRDALTARKPDLVLDSVAELRSYAVTDWPDAWWGAATILLELALQSGDARYRAEAAAAVLTLVDAGQFEAVGLGADGGTVLSELDPWLRAELVQRGQDSERQLRSLRARWIGDDPKRGWLEPVPPPPLPRELKRSAIAMGTVASLVCITVIATDADRLFGARSVVDDLLWVLTVVVLVSAIVGGVVLTRLLPWRGRTKMPKAAAATGVAVAIALLLVALPLRSRGTGFLPPSLARLANRAPAWALAKARAPHHQAPTAAALSPGDLPMMGTAPPDTALPYPTTTAETTVPALLPPVGPTVVGPGSAVPSSRTTAPASKASVISIIIDPRTLYREICGPEGHGSATVRVDHPDQVQGVQIHIGPGDGSFQPSMEIYHQATQVEPGVWVADIFLKSTESGDYHAEVMLAGNVTNDTWDAGTIHYIYGCKD